MSICPGVELYGYNQLTDPPVQLQCTEVRLFFIIPHQGNSLVTATETKFVCRDAKFKTFLMKDFVVLVFSSC